MKHFFVLMIAFTSFSGSLKADPIDLNTAREVALKFVNADTRTLLRGKANAPSLRSNDLRLQTTYHTKDGRAAFHVFNTPTGFVIVSADDCATPILGYSDEGRPFDLDDIPIQLKGYLKGFVEQIEYGIEKHLKADEKTARQWEMVKKTGKVESIRSKAALDDRFTKNTLMISKDSLGRMARKEYSIGDLINSKERDVRFAMPSLSQVKSLSEQNGVGPLITVQWDQECLYNTMCPADDDGACGHVPTGCVATAMGMIMHYWGYPTQGTGSHSYTPDGYPEQSVDFGETTYDWDNMPDQLDANSTQAQIDAVSTLLWHCGVAVDMVYGNISNALDEPIPQAFSEYFGFCYGAHFKYKEDDSSWLEQVKSSLDAGQPLIYFALDTDGLGGHAFICDGYNAEDQLHFNWGWGGEGNGYFAVDALNVNEFQFNNNVHALFGVLPPSEFQLQYNIIEGGAEVTYEQPEVSIPAYSSYPDTIVIPSQVTIEGITYPVVAIGDKAFQCCWDLKSVEIPSTITRIGDYAFYSYYNITQIDLPDSLTVIGDCALMALSISSLNLPDGLKSIGMQALSFINIMNYELGLNDIEDYLTSLTIPLSVTSIGEGLTSITAVDTVYWNADSCVITTRPNQIIPLFQEAKAVYLGGHVRYLPGELFWLTDITEVKIPLSVEEMGFGVFEDCKNLSRVDFNATHCHNADRVFYDCPNLHTINFGDAVKEIPCNLCWVNSAITSITIPDSVAYIGEAAFSDCSNLHKIVMLPTTPPVLGSGAFLNIDEEVTIVVSCESYNEYYNDWPDEDLRHALRSTPETEIQLTALPDDPLHGSVVLYKNASVCDSSVVFFAKANFGYHFDHWNDGSTNNPESLSLTCDTTVVAYFAKDQFNVDGVAGKPIFSLISIILMKMVFGH
ncbi:MAG: C10 family peptidase [Bacteroidales bacterium]|nr:C10 family peptidase [Bacteroidales bacterium]